MVTKSSIRQQNNEYQSWRKGFEKNQENKNRERGENIVLYVNKSTITNGRTDTIFINEKEKGQHTIVEKRKIRSCEGEVKLRKNVTSYWRRKYQIMIMQLNW